MKNIHLSKRIEYCFGNDLELLSALLVLAVCQDSKVFQIRKFPLSITLSFHHFHNFFHTSILYMYISISRIYILVFKGFCLEAESLQIRF